MDGSQIGLLLFYLPILLFSVIVHECSHGLVALWNGDPTAKYAGRLTLNPIPHLDLYGSILFPGILMLTGSRFLFAWAKPVPVDDRNLRGKLASVMVAAAGPVSNLILAYVFALVLSGLYRLNATGLDAAVLICAMGVRVNCLLAVFNLLPIPPLDGHWFLLRVLPPNLARSYARIGFLGIILIILLFLIPGVSEVLVQRPVRFLSALLLRGAGLPSVGLS